MVSSYFTFPSGIINFVAFCSLSEMMLNLMEISLASGVPASLRNIPDKYNIIISLWTNCFYRLLENLRRSSLSFKIALEYLQEFIYYAYTFYTALLERNTFSDYCTGWLEALGDLVQYRIIITAMVPTTSHGSSSLTTAAINGGLRTSPVGLTMSLSGVMSTTSTGGGSPETCTAQVVAEFPGHGKLHHLGLLNRKAEGDELRAVYYFVKR